MFRSVCQPIGRRLLPVIASRIGRIYAAKFQSTDVGSRLIGKWANELGSTVEFTSCEDGSLCGKYNSHVGEAEGFYHLSGRYTAAVKKPEDCILGFSVAWNNDVDGNSDSTSSWTGVYIASDDASKDKIFTKWILTDHTPPEDMWKNTCIGEDVFKRQSK